MEATRTDRRCARHENPMWCDGDRKDVVIDGTHYLICKKGRNEIKAQRAARTRKFKAAHMELPL